MKIQQLNEEIERLIQEIRALNKVLFNINPKFSYKLKVEKDKMWKKVEFLKNMKKHYISEKDYF